MPTLDDTPLGRLLIEHDRLNQQWTSDRTFQQARHQVAAAWSIWTTHPPTTHRGDLDIAGYLEAVATDRCQPTVLSSDTRDWGDNPGGSLRWRGACRGCGWVSDITPSENTATETAMDHSHPGWRDMPVIDSSPAGGDKKQVAKWEAHVRAMYPPAWLDSGGPILTARKQFGRRHVPGRAPGGGYDMAGERETVEQLALV